MQKYYMVWNPLTKFTNYRHESYVSAKEEAIRLAKLHSENEFVVLIAIATIKKQDVVIDEVPTDEIPF